MLIYQVVLDTNVLLSGLRSRRGASYKLLTLLNDERFQVNISTALIFEYEEVLKRNIDQLGLTSQDIDKIIFTICAIANQQTIFYLWRPLAKDPDDDFLIDLAVEAKADFIISYNKKDLNAAEQFGIQIVTSKEFLKIIGEISR